MVTSDGHTETETASRQSQGCIKLPFPKEAVVEEYRVGKKDRGKKGAEGG